MYYKQDWPQAKERMEAFWRNEWIDRCCVAVTAPRKTSPYGSHAALNAGMEESLQAIAAGDEKGFERWWTDPELNYQRMIAWFENTWFGGEAIPCTYVNWGAMAMACFYGSQPVFNRETVWYTPVIQDWEAWEWRFDWQNNLYWRQTQAIVNCLLENCAGRYFVGMPEFGDGADVLSLMRGMDRLALDLLEYPDHVHRAIQVLSGSWIDLHEHIYQMTFQNNQGGTLPWMLLWAPGRISQLACDFSSILSPRMFRQFFIPEVRREGDWCEYGTYHLDGPPAMKSTLDTLLGVEQIDTIQWTPGENLPPTFSPQYIPAYQKIQAAGKRLFLLVEPHEIEPLLAELSPRGLMLRTRVDSEEEGQKLLTQAADWSARSPKRNL